jgi:hypothetical protein
MLLRCNPDAADVANNGGNTSIHYISAYKWQFFADEKEQVRNDLKQYPSY